MRDCSATAVPFLSAVREHDIQYRNASSHRPETFRVFMPAAVGGTGIRDQRNVLITQLIPPRSRSRGATQLVLRLAP
jgi:hypothetical protein